MLNLVILNYGTGIGNTFIAYPLDLLLLNNVFFVKRQTHLSSCYGYTFSIWCRARTNFSCRHN